MPVVLCSTFQKKSPNVSLGEKYPVRRDIIKSGTPEYLHDEDSIRYFFHIVDKMKEDRAHWDTPPLIVNYVQGRFEVNDGRHRLEMYRQLGVQEIEVVLWVTGDKDYEDLLEVLSC